MTIHSGKRAVLNGQSTVRNWTINDDVTNPRFYASNTKGGAVRSDGISAWAGSFGIYGHTPIVMPGEIFAFLGYTSPADNISGVGERYSGNAIVDSLVVNWNWAGGEILNAAINFSGHLGLSAASGAEISDATAPVANPVTECIWEYSLDGVAWNPIEDLLTATLTITSENVAYVNSSTGGETGRVAGNIDWTLALTQQDVVRGLYGFTKGTILQLRGYVDAIDFWLLKWGKVKGFTNITADVESAAIIGRTINIEMMGHNAAGTVGEITQPGAGAAWWPF